MMRIAYILVLSLFWQFCSAQQDLQYTQFNSAKLYYNPGIAGADDHLSILGRHRNQWAGILGAPQSQSLLVDFPRLYESLGFGLSINKSSIGVNDLADATGMYAYHLNTKAANFSLGLQLSYRQLRQDFTREGLLAINGFEVDPSLQQDKRTQSVFNVGFGFYLHNKIYDIGVSIPRLAKAGIDANSESNEQATEARHIYGFFGLRLPLGDFWKVHPATIIKIPENGPLDIDIQSNFIYNDQVHMGMNIRTGGTQETLFESMAVILGFNFTPSIFAALSYDFTTTAIREYEDGSFEILIKYSFLKNKLPKHIQNPRYY